MLRAVTSDLQLVSDQITNDRRNKRTPFIKGTRLAGSVDMDASSISTIGQSTTLKYCDAEEIQVVQSFVTNMSTAKTEEYGSHLLHPLTGRHHVAFPSEWHTPSLDKLFLVARERENQLPYSGGGW